MIFVALLGIGLAFVGQVWHTEARREKEKELLFVGDQFRAAIYAYYSNNTGAGDRYPKTFDEMLLDRHQPTVRRYLRRVYVDPLTGTAEWGLIKTAAGGIMGVYSLAPGQPLKQAGFTESNFGFSGASSYTGWQFIYAAPEGTSYLPTPVSGNPAEPVAAAPPAPPVIPVIAPPKPGDPNKDRRCAYIASLDARACATEKAKWGSNADCESSAQFRQAACEAGEPLPSLQVRYR
jgi:hypothetical protein